MAGRTCHGTVSSPINLHTRRPCTTTPPAGIKNEKPRSRDRGRRSRCNQWMVRCILEPIHYRAYTAGVLWLLAWQLDNMIWLISEINWDNERARRGNYCLAVGWACVVCHPRWLSGMQVECLLTKAGFQALYTPGKIFLPSQDALCSSSMQIYGHSISDWHSPVCFWPWLCHRSHRVLTRGRVLQEKVMFVISVIG